MLITFLRFSSNVDDSLFETYPEMVNKIVLLYKSYRLLSKLLCGYTISGIYNAEKYYSLIVKIIFLVTTISTE